MGPGDVLRALMRRADVAMDLPRIEHSPRRDRLRTAIADSGLDSVLLTRPSDVRYLTGFEGSSGAVLVGSDPDSDVLVTDRRYRETTAGLDVATVEHSRRVESVLGGTNARRLGIDDEHLTVAAASRLVGACEGRVELLPARHLVESQRLVKDWAEIARLEAACRITACALSWLIIEHGLEGHRELDLGRALESKFLELGSDGVAFPTIVASGINAASPHHRPTDRIIRSGELVVLDGGARIDGYCADMTRTVAVGGYDRLQPVVQKLLRVAVAANETARAACRVGKTAESVDASARGVVVAAGMEGLLLHPTGHGVGLDIHEAPWCAPGQAVALESGVVLTVEPGLYLQGFSGARIEDTVLLTDAGPRILTDLPRGFEGLDSIVRGSG